MTGNFEKMTMADGAAVAVYRALPDGERRGGLVLVQEIFGVTEHIREMCHEYAADGYEVLAPALFDREEPKVSVILHFGRFDSSIPVEGVEKVAAKAWPNATVYVYEAGHGFNSDRRKDYHEPSADLARERTLALFRANGG